MQELLAEGDFVRSLARHLLGGADADDLVQETWLAALRRRPLGLEQPRAWLARVVARLAANQRRTDRRRAEREQKVAEMRPTEAPSTAAILACEQVRQRVVAAVLALDEPFRRTLLARFYECLDSEAIAARDRVNIATVRSRLKRGLDRLRARLDGEHGGRAAWAAPLTLLGGHPAPTTLPLGAAMASSKKAAAVVAAVALLGLALWASDVLVTEGRSPLPQPVATGLDVGGGAQQPDDDSHRTATDIAGQSDRTHEGRGLFPYPVTDEPVDEVPLRVLDAETREPVAGAEVAFLPFRVDHMSPRGRGDQELQELDGCGALLERFGSRLRADASGAATIRIPRSGSEVLASDGDRRARIRVAPTQLLPGERVTLWLEAVRWVRLRVVDESSGSPVRGALLERASSMRESVVSHGEGRYGLVGPTDEHGLVTIALTDREHSLRVCPWVVGCDRYVAIELPAAFERVTEVRFPSTGSMTIELRTPSGELWPSPITAGIRPDTGPASQNTGPVAWRSSEHGAYKLPYVPLGKCGRLTRGRSAEAAQCSPPSRPVRAFPVRTSWLSCVRRASRASLGRTFARPPGRRRPRT